MFGGKDSMRSNAKFAKMLRSPQQLAQPTQGTPGDVMPPMLLKWRRFCYLDTPLSCICTHTSAELGSTLRLENPSISIKQKTIPRTRDIIMDVASSSVILTTLLYLLIL